MLLLWRKMKNSWELKRRDFDKKNSLENRLFTTFGQIFVLFFCAILRNYMPIGETHIYQKEFPTSRVNWTFPCYSHSLPPSPTLLGNTCFVTVSLKVFHFTNDIFLSLWISSTLKSGWFTNKLKWCQKFSVFHVRIIIFLFPWI